MNDESKRDNYNREFSISADAARRMLEFAMMPATQFECFVDEIDECDVHKGRVEQSTLTMSAPTEVQLS